MGFFLILGTLALSAGMHAAPRQEPTPVRTTGTIRCRVFLRGPVPECPVIDVDKTVEHCGKTLVDPVLLVHDGGLENAIGFLQLEGDLTPSPSKPADVSLQTGGCLMTPRIQCARLGDRLVLRNSDSTPHNPHGWLPSGKTAFNLTLFPGLELARPLKESGIYRIDCDIHSWMHSYVHVFDHSWFAQSGADGVLTIPAVPAGQRTLLVWHEVLGMQSQQLLVEPGRTTEVAIGFDFRDMRAPAVIPRGMRRWPAVPSPSDAPRASNPGG